MSQPDETPSLGWKPSGFLNFWKKPRSPNPGKASTTPAESDLLLPTEIWFDILAGTPGYALEPLSRVSKRLRRIVLPLYLGSQQIFPFVETFAFRRLNVRVELAGYQERARERLEFLSGEQFSPVVRDLFVSPYPPGYNRRHRVEHRPIEDIMKQLILVLPRFCNLKKLVLHFPFCSETLLSSLTALQLDSFELEMLPTAQGEIPVPARTEFFFDRSTSPIQIFPPASLSLRFMFPASLERLVAGPTGTDTIARALLQHPLPSLHTLDLSLRFAASPHFADALAACPNLISIRLRSTAIDGSGIPPFLPPLPRTTIPRLSSYHGPLGFAPAFARNRTLRAARLWSSHSVSAVSTPSLLPPILHTLGPALERLEIGVTVVPESLLETIRDAFPALTVLAINAHLDSFHPGTVERHVLTTALQARLAPPRGLGVRALRLGVQLPGTSHQELGESARAAVEAFPGGYDPTSWRRWVVDQAWYCVEWTRVEGADAAVPADGDADAKAGSGTEGTLTVEYGEHYFRSFDRGSRISSRTVDEAILRIS
ncbi:hypothetical protein B0H17DRAFT_1205946 [Mycena rosella]|uniref:F-box domain-containing protein n=1 Tax=Mycena rosella TaxID=1033263 RepID=A0AAD7G9R8_MYCRO|nr:hypothetical protein B0H17DRAFT_1205946 [Mycena rosella]